MPLCVTLRRISCPAESLYCNFDANGELCYFKYLRELISPQICNPGNAPATSESLDLGALVAAVATPNPKTKKKRGSQGEGGGCRAE